MQKTSKTWIWLFSLTLALLCVGGLWRFAHGFAADAVYPLENGVAWLRRGFARRAAPFFRAQAVVSRVQALEDEVARLRLDAAMLEQIAVENRELRRELRLPPGVLRVPERCLPLSWGGALGWWQSVRVNKGSAAGVAEGDAVVTADGLVGRVRRVFHDSADVELLTDSNSRVACALDLPEGLPSVRGILQGAGWRAGAEGLQGFLYVSDPLRLEYMRRELPGGGEIPARTRVVTSGLSGSIPGGIAVGWLVETEVDPDGLYRTGKVLPAVDFANLKTMFVLVSAGGAP